MGRNNPINLLRGFAAAKCLTVLNLTIARIKVTRKRRNLLARQIRGDIAQLFRSGQAAHVYDTKIAFLIREENTVAAYDLIDRYCHLLVSQFSMVETQRNCPLELKESITSLIYAAPRCTDLPELTEVKDMLTTKYGKEFAVAANELKPDCGVSRDIIELLSMQPPSGKIRLKLMKDICLQHNIEWRSEWAPEASIIPSTPFGMQDSKRIEMDEGNIKVQRAQRAPSNMRPLKVDQDMDPHHNRGSMHGEDSISKNQEARANTRAAHGMAEPYHPAVGSKRETLPKEQVSKINMRVSQGTKEPYDPGIGSKCENADDAYRSASSRYNPKQGLFPGDKPASPGYDLKQGSFLREELTRSNLRVSENINSPPSYSPGFGPPGDKATRANMKGGANEPYKLGFVPMHGKEAARGNEQVSQGKEEICKAGHNAEHSPLPKQEHEPDKTNGASFGRHKVADYKEVVHQDRAENIMQHPDEISDSGSDIFVSVEDDDAALSHKEGTSTTSGVSRNSFQEKKEGKSSNTNFRAQASRELGLDREGYHRGNSQRSNMENSLETNQSPHQKPNTDNRGQKHYLDTTKWDEQPSFQVQLEKSFKANQGRSNSNCWQKPQNLSGEPNIASDVPWVEKVVQESAALSPDLHDSFNEHEFASMAKAIAAEAARLAILNYAKQYSRSRSSPMDVDNVEDNMSHTTPEGCDADDDDNDDRAKKGNGYISYKPSKTTHNETPNASAKLFAANTSSDAKINAERPAFGRAHAQSYRGSSGSCNADASKRPVFYEEPDVTDERPHRSKHIEGMPDPGNQHEFSSNIKARTLFSTEYDPYFDGLTREEELTYPNQMSREKGKKWTGTAVCDKRGSTKATQSINYHDDKCNLVNEDTKSHAMRNKNSELPSGPRHGKGHEEDLDYIEKGKLETSGLRKGAPTQAKESQRTVFSAANVKGHNYGMGEQALQEQATLQEDKLLEVKMEEQRRPPAKTNDSQDPASRSGKVIHQRREKSVVDDVLGARLHREEASGKVALQDKERLRGSEGIQNKQQEPTTRSRLLTTDSHIDKKNPSQHSQDPELVSLYKPHGQVDDFLNRPMSVRNKPQGMSVRNKPQGRQEEFQATASGYKPYVLKQEDYEEERIPPSKQYNHDQPQQLKHQSKQDTWPAGNEHPQNKSLHPKANPFAVDHHKHGEENASAISPNRLQKLRPKHHEEGQEKDRKQYDREHKKPAAFTSGSHKQDEPNSARMIPNQVGGPPTRNPPPLPQRNHPSKGAEWNQQPLMYGNQKKQVLEEVYEHGHVKKLDRRATPPTRPPPPVIVRASERERAEKESGAQARSLPEEPRRLKSPSSTPASSDPHNVAHKPPSPSQKSQSSVSASSPMNPKMDAPKTPSKLPHVDDIAANLEALRQARLGKA